LSVLRITELGPSRPPCSVAEREAADAVQRNLRSFGLRPAVEHMRAPTSPTWAPLVRALLRVWAAAFLAAGWPVATTAMSAAATIGVLGPVAGLIRFIPLLGAPSRNVVAHRRGRDSGARPMVVCAHLDTHPTAGTPLSRLHAFLALMSGLVALTVGVAAEPGVAGWRPVAALVAAEAAITMAMLARRELATQTDPPDDNTSGLLALVRLAELVSDGSQSRDMWIVATAGGTSGSYGLKSFLRQHRELRKAWIVEIDALGTGEVVASPFPARFPYPGTPPQLVRAVVAAARYTGDPLTVRRIRRPHSDARAGLRARAPAIALTGGLRPPAAGEGPDAANAERAARVVDSLARLDDAEPSTGN
jgi:hypothetical protein